MQRATQTRAAPALTSALGTFVDDCLAGTFRDAAANGQSVSSHGAVAHSVLVVLDVGDVFIKFLALFKALDVTSVKSQIACH